MVQIKNPVLYAGAFLLTFAIVYLYKRWAVHHAILDIPNERSSHIAPTPRGGGIAIVLTFYLGLFLLHLNGKVEKALFYALLPGLMLTLTGFIDDIYRLAPMIRFIIQLICSGIALYFMGGLHGIIGSDQTGLWSGLALVGMVWFINLFNFLDGSDGYASMEAISILLTIWYFVRMDLLLVLAFSVGGFLYWNWPKARIFMGDAGSNTLGFILVVLGVYLHNNSSFSIFYWILITALFWFDATLTLYRRFRNKEKLSQAHKNHMYQRAIQGGFSHLKTMISGLGINILLFLICFAIYRNYIPFLPGFITGLIILSFAMKYVDRIFAFNYNRTKI